MADAAPIQNLLNAYQTALEADATLSTNLGGRIYHMVAHHDDSLPLLVWELIENPLQRHFAGEISVTIRIRHVIWADRRVGLTGATGAASIENDLYDAVDDTELTATGFDRGVVLFSTRGVRSLVDDAIALQSDAIIRATTSP